MFGITDAECNYSLRFTGDQILVVIEETLGSESVRISPELFVEKDGVHILHYNRSL
jgi:hypothetical protein